MKKTLLVSLVVSCVTVFSAGAQNAKPGKAVPKEDQQALRDSIIQKYDLNGDGVLDKAETKKLSKADKKFLARTGGVGTARKSKVKPGKGEEIIKPERKPVRKPETKPQVVKPATRPEPVPKPEDAQPASEAKRAEKSARGKSAK